LPAPTPLCFPQQGRAGARLKAREGVGVDSEPHEAVPPRCRAWLHALPARSAGRPGGIPRWRFPIIADRPTPGGLHAMRSKSAPIPLLTNPQSSVRLPGYAMHLPPRAHFSTLHAPLPLDRRPDNTPTLAESSMQPNQKSPKRSWNVYENKGSASGRFGTKLESI
jgi:hypothetical protein